MNYQYTLKETKRKNVLRVAKVEKLRYHPSGHMVFVCRHHRGWYI